MGIREWFARRGTDPGAPADGITPATDGPRARPTTHWATARRAGAVFLLLGWVALLWVSFQTSYLHICDDEVARVGHVPLVRSCRPLSVTDGPMLAILIV